MQQRGILDGDRQAALRKRFLNWCLNPLLYCLPSDYGEVTLSAAVFCQNTNYYEWLGYYRPRPKTIQDPVALSILDTLKERLKRSQHDLDNLYPVRAIANRTIVNSDLLPSSAMVRTLDQLEAEIEGGYLLELKRFAGGRSLYG